MEPFTHFYICYSKKKSFALFRKDIKLVPPQKSDT